MITWAFFEQYIDKEDSYEVPQKGEGEEQLRVMIEGKEMTREGERDNKETNNGKLEEPKGTWRTNEGDLNRTGIEGNTVYKKKEGVAISMKKRRQEKKGKRTGRRAKELNC